MKQSKEVAREEMDYHLEQERDYAKKINAEQDATIKRDKIIIYLAVTFCFISALMLALIIVLFYKRQKKNRLKEYSATSWNYAQNNSKHNRKRYRKRIKNSAPLLKC